MKKLLLLLVSFMLLFQIALGQKNQFDRTKVTFSPNIGLAPITKATIIGASLSYNNFLVDYNVGFHNMSQEYFYFTDIGAGFVTKNKHKSNHAIIFGLESGKTIYYEEDQDEFYMTSFYQTNIIEGKKFSTMYFKYKLMTKHIEFGLGYGIKSGPQLTVGFNLWNYLNK